MEDAEARDYDGGEEAGQQDVWGPVAQVGAAPGYCNLQNREESLMNKIIGNTVLCFLSRAAN